MNRNGHWRIARLLTVGMLCIPSVMLPQKREDFVAIQRELAQMEEAIKTLRDQQTQQASAVTALLQQTLDESRKASASAGSLQRSIEQHLADLQSKLAGPVATLGSKVDQMSDDFRSVQANVQELVRRMGKLDEKLTDISIAVRTINQPVQAPPAANDPNKPPAGVTSEGLFQNAFRDYSGGKEELALAEFADYLKYFPESENAPAAQYYIGQIYDHGKMYKDAVQAFDAVQKYPPNPRAGDALYMKAVDLQKDGQKTEAAKVFKEFIERFPTHGSVVGAKAHLKELGVNAPGSHPGPRKKGSQ